MDKHEKISRIGTGAFNKYMSGMLTEKGFLAIMRALKALEIENGGEYDSTYDTMIHKFNVFTVMNLLIKDSVNRAIAHDNSKMESPEKEIYDKFIPQLKPVKYGTPEYIAVTSQMKKEGGNHHNQVNRHHPEYFENRVDGMNIIDLLEMICDWFAASIRSDSPFLEGLNSNIKRHNISPQLENIIRNTYNEYFKDIEDDLVKENDYKRGEIN